MIKKNGYANCVQMYVTIDGSVTDSIRIHKWNNIEISDIR